jgi:hypothetical protein
MTTIMEMVEYTKRKSNEHKRTLPIYHLNKTNMLIEEQKPDKDNHSQNHQNEMFDIIININTRPQKRHNTQQV